MSDDVSEGFLGRWSRTKRGVASPSAAPQDAPVANPDVNATRDPAPDLAPATLSQEELDALPRIEDLIEGSDIRAFLRAGVPRQLRNAAMRRMWMLTPGIRDYSDPAVDYAWDWNTPGGVPGDGIAPSSETAAKMLKQIFKPQEDEADDRTAEVVPTTSQEAEDPAMTQQQGAGAAAAHATADAQTTTVAQDAPPAAPELPPRRRHGSALPD